MSIFSGSFQLKELDQIKSYQRFIKSKLEENDRGLTQVKAYIIGKESAKVKAE